MQTTDNPHAYQTDDTYENWITALKSQWEQFRSVANKCVDYKTFHEANQTLGFNLGKSVPALILELEKRQQYCDRISREMLELDKKAAKTEKAQAVIIEKLQQKIEYNYREWWGD